MPHGKEIPFPKRVAILTLHWHGNKNWVEISTLLKVHPDTARQICVRAKERASDPNDFDDVVMHLESVGSRGESWGKGAGSKELSQEEDAFVGMGGIEGMTAMRDMDWR